MAKLYFGAGILAIALALIFGGTKIYLQNKESSLKKEKFLSDLIFSLQQTALDTKKDLENLRKELGLERKRSIESAKTIAGQLEEEKAKRLQEELRQKSEEEKTGQQISELTKSVAEAKPYNLAAIIKEWRPRIAHVECQWESGGLPLFYKNGSGLLVKDGFGAAFILTNKHVVLEQETQMPAVCEIKFPDYSKTFSVTSDGIEKSAIGYDWAKIFLVSDSYTSQINSADIRVCREIPLLGDNIAILGYPSIGAQTDITATEGIISGYDGNYYITSAKVDLGNSGGTAILLKSNCNLGMPTFTKTGKAESLARILKSTLIFGSGF